MTRTRRVVSRSGHGHTSRNTLVAGPEVRHIFIAQGKQFRNGDPWMPWELPGVLRSSGIDRVTLLRQAGYSEQDAPAHALRNLRSIPLVQTSATTSEFFDANQGVLFKIKLVNTKTDFISALKTPGAHVVYDGHARYGRGPCFGPGHEAPGEAWEEGDGLHPNATGIFRMGFPFIGIPAREILTHQYHTHLVKNREWIAAEDCNYGLRKFVGNFRPLTLNEIDPALATWVVGADPSARYNTYRSSEDGETGVRFVVLKAGWKKTNSEPDDLGAVDPLCRVFCHFGCSTYGLNQPIVRSMKQWRREGNERYAYFTTGLSDCVLPVYWLQAILTCPTPNAFKSWKVSLDYAVNTVNRWLLNDDQTYQIR